MKRNVRGFTLIELMITVVIVAILAAIAIPNYSDYVKKSRRNEAMQALFATINAMEKFRLSQNAYPGSISALDGVTGSHGLTADGSNWITENGFYRIEIWFDVNGNPNSAVAFPQGPQLSDSDCQRFDLFLNGNRRSTDSDGTINTDTCWAD